MRPTEQLLITQLRGECPDGTQSHLQVSCRSARRLQIRRADWAAAQNQTWEAISAVLLDCRAQDFGRESVGNFWGSLSSGKSVLNFSAVVALTREKDGQRPTPRSNR